MKRPLDWWIPARNLTSASQQKRSDESPQNQESTEARMEFAPTANGNGPSKPPSKPISNGNGLSKTPSPRRPRTAADRNRELDEVDDIPIGELYVPLPKQPRTAAAAKKVNKEQSRKESAQIHPTATEVQPAEAGGPSGPVSMSIVDPDVLDCPICFEPLSSPVYQCENGHIACASCCTTVLENKCANCRLPIQKIRNRAIEKVLESVIVTCQNKHYGCKKKVSYSDKVAHEKACNYHPCSCPCIDCDFVGNSKHLYNHFALNHKDSCKTFYFNITISISMDTTQKHVILREGREGVIFVVDRCIETLGSFLKVVCLAPTASENRFSYDLSAFIGEDSIRVKTSMEMMPKWTAQPHSKMSLLVPSNLISTSQLLVLYLIITKKPAHAN